MSVKLEHKVPTKSSLFRSRSLDPMTQLRIIVPLVRRLHVKKYLVSPQKSPSNSKHSRHMKSPLKSKAKLQQENDKRAMLTPSLPSTPIISKPELSSPKSTLRSPSKSKTCPDKTSASTSSTPIAPTEQQPVKRPEAVWRRTAQSVVVEGPWLALCREKLPQIDQKNPNELLQVQNPTVCIRQRTPTRPPTPLGPATPKGPRMPQKKQLLMLVEETVNSPPRQTESGVVLQSSLIIKPLEVSIPPQGQLLSIAQSPLLALSANQQMQLHDNNLAGLSLPLVPWTPVPTKSSEKTWILASPQLAKDLSKPISEESLIPLAKPIISAQTLAAEHALSSQVKSPIMITQKGLQDVEEISSTESFKSVLEEIPRPPPIQKKEKSPVTLRSSNETKTPCSSKSNESTVKLTCTKARTSSRLRKPFTNRTPIRSPTPIKQVVKSQKRTNKEPQLVKTGQEPISSFSPLKRVELREVRILIEPLSPQIIRLIKKKQRTITLQNIPPEVQMQIKNVSSKKPQLLAKDRAKSRIFCPKKKNVPPENREPILSPTSEVRNNNTRIRSPSSVKQCISPERQTPNKTLSPDKTTLIEEEHKATRSDYLMKRNVPSLECQSPKNQRSINDDQTSLLYSSPTVQNVPSHDQTQIKSKSYKKPQLFIKEQKAIRSPPPIEQYVLPKNESPVGFLSPKKAQLVQKELKPAQCPSPAKFTPSEDRSLTKSETLQIAELKKRDPFAEQKLPKLRTRIVSSTSAEQDIANKGRTQIRSPSHTYQQTPTKILTPDRYVPPTNLPSAKYHPKPSTADFPIKTDTKTPLLAESSTKSQFVNKDPTTIFQKKCKPSSTSIDDLISKKIQAPVRSVSTEMPLLNEDHLLIHTQDSLNKPIRSTPPKSLHIEKKEHIPLLLPSPAPHTIPLKIHKPVQPSSPKELPFPIERTTIRSPSPTEQWLPTQQYEFFVDVQSAQKYQSSVRQPISKREWKVKRILIPPKSPSTKQSQKKLLSLRTLMHKAHLMSLQLPFIPKTDGAKYEQRRIRSPSPRRETIPAKTLTSIKSTSPSKEQLQTRKQAPKQEDLNRRTINMKSASSKESPVSPTSPRRSELMRITPIHLSSPVTQWTQMQKSPSYSSSSTEQTFEEILPKSSIPWKPPKGTLASHTPMKGRSCLLKTRSPSLVRHEKRLRKKESSKVEITMPDWLIPWKTPKRICVSPSRTIQRSQVMERNFINSPSSADARLRKIPVQQPSPKKVRIPPARKISYSQSTRNSKMYEKHRSPIHSSTSSDSEQLSSGELTPSPPPYPTDQLIKQRISVRSPSIQRYKYVHNPPSLLNETRKPRTKILRSPVYKESKKHQKPTGPPTPEPQSPTIDIPFIRSSFLMDPSQIPLPPPDLFEQHTSVKKGTPHRSTSPKNQWTPTKDITKIHASPPTDPWISARKQSNQSPQFLHIHTTADSRKQTQQTTKELLSPLKPWLPNQGRSARQQSPPEPCIPTRGRLPDYPQDPRERRQYRKISPKARRISETNISDPWTPLPVLTRLPEVPRVVSTDLWAQERCRRRTMRSPSPSWPRQQLLVGSPPLPPRRGPRSPSGSPPPSPTSSTNTYSGSSSPSMSSD